MAERIRNLARAGLTAAEAVVLGAEVFSGAGIPLTPVTIVAIGALEIYLNHRRAERHGVVAPALWPLRRGKTGKA